jgi:hypothetical protein
LSRVVRGGDLLRRGGTFLVTQFCQGVKRVAKAKHVWRQRHLSTANDTVLSWGEIFYRASLMLAGFVIALAVINSIYTASIAQPMIPVAPFVVAAVVWLIGLFCRYVTTW